MNTTSRRNHLGRYLKLAWLAALLLFPVATFAQERGAISGRVVSEDGRGLAGMRVSLSAPGQDSPRATTTDEEGHFQFNNLPDRNYVVSASGQKGYVAKPPAAGEPPRGRLRLGDSVTLTMIRGGVVTGRVTNPDGDPVVSIQVSALRVRDQEGNKTPFQGGPLPNLTDDRGVYRIYGLPPGTYIVVANSSPTMFGTLSPYYGETPTYHPSSTRDTAAEVKVAGGDEATGIDIRHRGDPGHAVSGKVLGIPESTEGNVAVSVSLRDAASNAAVGSAFIRAGQEDSGFAIYGVPDGEYELTANMGGSETDAVFYSDPRRVSVKGADATGVNLRLIPAATLAGRIAVEKSPTVCDAKLRTALEDLSVVVRRDESGEANSAASRLNFLRGGPADSKGEFKIKGIVQGRYRLQANLPNETWYIKSITGPAPAAAGRAATAKPTPADLTRGSLPLKPGDKYSGVTVTIADGGASLHGKVAPAGEGAKLPPRLQVHLIPAELTAVNDVLRFAERITARDGSFTFANLAPGKYWLLARGIPENEPPDRPPQPVAWDAAERAKLRKEAEVLKNEIELKPCDRVKDRVLRF